MKKHICVQKCPEYEFENERKDFAFCEGCNKKYYIKDGEIIEPEEIDIKKISTNYTLALEDTFSVKDANAIKQGRLSFVDSYGNEYEIVKHPAPHYELHYFNYTNNEHDFVYKLTIKQVKEYFNNTNIKVTNVIISDKEVK